MSPRGIQTCIKRITATLFALSFVAGGAQSQGTGSVRCDVLPASSSAIPPLDVCQKAADLFSFISPQIGVALAGGNPMLGEGGTLGGWGKRSGSVRVSVVDGQLPRNNIQLTSSTTPVSNDFGAKRTIVPVPSFLGAIGLLQGVPVGLSNVGGVDLLVGASFVPTVNRDPIALRTEHGGLALAYGLRVGALQESSIVPGIALSYLRRKLPTTDFDFTPGNDTLNVNNASVSSQSIRLTVSKRFVFFGIVGGVGRDMIKARSAFDVVINESIAGQAQRLDITIPVATEKVSRNTAFLNAAVGLPKLQLVGEFGWSSKGTIRQTVNTFGDRKANEGYKYGSLGIGFRF